MVDMDLMVLKDRAARAFIQVYHVKGHPVLRSTTRNIIDPSAAQIRARIAFSEAAKKSAESRKSGFQSPGCDIVRSEMKGKSFPGHRVRKPEWQKEAEWTARQFPAEEGSEMAKKIKYVRAVLSGEAVPIPLV